MYNFPSQRALRTEEALRIKQNTIKFSNLHCSLLSLLLIPNEYAVNIAVSFLIWKKLHFPLKTANYEVILCLHNGRLSEKIQNTTTKVKSCLGKNSNVMCNNNNNKNYFLFLAQEHVIMKRIAIIFLKWTHIKNMNAFTLPKSRPDVTVTHITF